MTSEESIIDVGTTSMGGHKVENHALSLGFLGLGFTLRFADRFEV